jgi:hypothetical protein
VDTRGGFFGRRNVADCNGHVNNAVFRIAFFANMNQEIIQAKTIIAELKLNNEIARQLKHTIGNLLTVQRFLLEQIHRTQTTLRDQSSAGPKLNKAVFAVNMTEKSRPNHHQMKTNLTRQSKNHHQRMIETVCLCHNGWICEDHPDRPRGHDGCDAVGITPYN